MNKPLVFFLGLIVGAGAIWFYSASVLVPQTAEKTRVEVLTTVETEKKSQELFVSGTVAAIDVTTGTIKLETMSALESATENAVTIMVTTDTNTAIRNASSEALPLTSLTVGSRVTVISNETIGNKTSIYAKEIVQL